MKSWFLDFDKLQFSVMVYFSGGKRSFFKCLDLMYMSILSVCMPAKARPGTETLITATCTLPGGHLCANSGLLENNQFT